MKTTTINIEDLATKLIALTDERDLKSFVFQHLAGNDNRFIRQNLIQHLTGVKQLLVKCGVSYVISHVQAFQAEPQNDMDVVLAKAEPESEIIDEFTPKIEGTPKTAKGTPTAVEGTPTTVEGTPEKLPAYKIEVGTPVIRKQCKRKGVIKANANGKMEIHLEDGSIRKPASSRFYSLYNFQN